MIGNVCFLYHYEDHFCVITSIKAFVNSSYFCTKCLAEYDHKYEHKCEGFCMQCRTFECDGKTFDIEEEKKMWKKCDKCLRSFKTAKCFKAHLREMTCDNLYICKDCHSFVDKKRSPKGLKEHRCNRLLLRYLLLVGG